MTACAGFFYANGKKLKVVSRWASTYSTSPVIGSAINTASLNNTKTTDYIGNFVYENGSLTRILTENGYYSNKNYYFYIRNHLGSNATVADINGNIVQQNHFYPFGQTMAISTGQGAQPYKFTGKELDLENGLNLYDFDARTYDPSVGRFTSVDPLAEKYYSISPYAYCHNNPLNVIDPTGMTDYRIYSDGRIVDTSSLWDKIKRIFTGPDSTDKLIASNGKSLEMAAGTMKDITAEKDATGKTTKTSFTVEGSEKAEIIHEFVSENTNVEFSNVDAVKNGQEKSVISTIHSPKSVDALTDATNLIKSGFEVTQITHSHPAKGSPIPSGYASGQIDDNDKRGVTYMNTHYPSNLITWRVYGVKTKQYIYYNEKRIYKTENKKKR